MFIKCLISFDNVKLPEEAEGLAEVITKFSEALKNSNIKSSFQTTPEPVEVVSVPAPVKVVAKKATPQTPPDAPPQALKELVAKILETKGKEKVVALLKSFNAEKFSQLSPEHYEAFEKAILEL